MLLRKIPSHKLGLLLGFLGISASVFILASSFGYEEIVDIEKPTLAKSPLIWSPPSLTSPTTINLSTGETKHTLDTNKDYIIKLPPTKKIGRTWIEGGRNITIIGGHITIPPTDPVVQDDGFRRAIYIKNTKGIVHIEGVLIDSSAGGESDAITINAPEATVQIQNIRVETIKGTNNSMHADVIQPWGGVKELRVYNLTGSSYYQGLYLAYDTGGITKADLRNIDLTALGESYGSHGGGYMLSFTKGNCNNLFSVILRNVYVVPRSNRTLGKSVWPDINTASTSTCAGVESNSTVSWPTISQISGEVIGGLPPGGNFVPAGVAGTSYTSPGYANQSNSPQQTPQTSKPNNSNSPAQDPINNSPSSVDSSQPKTTNPNNLNEDSENSMNNETTEDNQPSNSVEDDAKDNNITVGKIRGKEVNIKAPLLLTGIFTFFTALIVLIVTKHRIRTLKIQKEGNAKLNSSLSNEVIQPDNNSETEL